MKKLLANLEGQGETPFDPPSDFFGIMGFDDGYVSLVASHHVKIFADLRGKTKYVDSIRNSFSFSLGDMPVRNGIPESDVQWASADGTDRRSAALMYGQHAATMLRTPLDLQTEKTASSTSWQKRVTPSAATWVCMGAAQLNWSAENAAKATPSDGSKRPATEVRRRHR